MLRTGDEFSRGYVCARGDVLMFALRVAGVLSRRRVLFSEVFLRILFWYIDCVDMYVCMV